jgi:hypothetical protein
MVRDAFRAAYFFLRNTHYAVRTSGRRQKAPLCEITCDSASKTTLHENGPGSFRSRGHSGRTELSLIDHKEGLIELDRLGVFNQDFFDRP